MKFSTPLLLLLVGVVMLVTIQLLPAPISEVETPSPTARPKPTRAVESESKQSQKLARAPTPTPSPVKKFAGKWSGIMAEVPWGNVQTELIVDPTETTVEWQESGRHKGSAAAQLKGNTLSARIPMGFQPVVWYITANPDGMTASIRMTAFMNDDHAVFRRVSQ